MVLWMLMVALFVAFGEDSPEANFAVLALYVPFIWISLAVSVKRWHDRDKSGWWILIGLVPLIGSIWQFIENAPDALSETVSEVLKLAGHPSEPISRV